MGFDEFVAARYGALVRAAFVLTGERSAAEDLVQSALLRAWPAWRRGLEHPEAYVRTIMVRLVVRGRRRLWRGEVPVADVPEVAVPDLSRRVETTALVVAALRSLSVEHRAVLVLRYLSGLSEAETAQVLRCSVGTVKSRSSRALAAVRASGLLDDLEVP